jgi:hypothetical protein
VGSVWAKCIDVCVVGQLPSFPVLVGGVGVSVAGESMLRYTLRPHTRFNRIINDEILKPMLSTVGELNATNGYAEAKARFDTGARACVLHVFHLITGVRRHCEKYASVCCRQSGLSAGCHVGHVVGDTDQISQCVVHSAHDQRKHECHSR